MNVIAGNDNDAYDFKLSVKWYPSSKGLVSIM